MTVIYVTISYMIVSYRKMYDIPDKTAWGYKIRVLPSKVESLI